MNMKKLMLVMLLGLSSTVALRASERRAPVPSGQEKHFRDMVTQFFAHPDANMGELEKFRGAVEVALQFNESDREQRVDKSALMRRELSVVPKDAPKKELELPQSASEKALAKMTPAQLKSLTKAQALVRGVAARRKMGDTIKINANMKQMDLLREMVESYAREGNHAMIDFCLTLFSRVDLGEIGLTHGDMGQWLMQKKSAPERARGAASSAQQKK